MSADKSYRLGELVTLDAPHELKCPHTRAGNWIANWRDDPNKPGWVLLVSQYCRKCKDYLSQGHSDEAPVAAEIRAAEIAVKLSEDGCMMSMLETCGFNDELPRLRGGVHTIELDTAAQRAGYLAHTIASHEEEA